MTEATDAAANQQVRFDLNHEKITHTNPLELAETNPSEQDDISKGKLSDEERAKLRDLSLSLHKSRMQAARAQDFAFEPVSVPVSRAPSPSQSSADPSREVTRSSGGHSPHASPPTSQLTSPPLTPKGSFGKDKEGVPPKAQGIAEAAKENEKPTAGEVSPRGRRSESPAATAAQGPPVDSVPKPLPRFSLGPANDSVPTSEHVSPQASPGTNTPVSPSSRPFTPSDDPNDQYNRSRRVPQTKKIEDRFVFDRTMGRGSIASGSSTTARGSIVAPENKRLSILGAGSEDSSGSHHGHHHHKSQGSMADLKRFFKFGGHKSKDKEKRERSPAPGRSSRPSSIYGKIPSGGPGSGARTPPHQAKGISAGVPFADDHSIEDKYGKFGKVLGSGAGGSVRLMKRSSDGVTFAVKQFRPRHSYESEKEYAKKVTAEFCIGSTLHHGNIIETMDIIHERGNWYEVMEYAPYDLFNIVMTGKMSREEVSCCTLQILNGVQYLHSMGLAHRDLKLDNVVVNEHGIMKIIDFGSAVVFRYPFESGITLATGIVGSDPYLAPEVYDRNRYDPQPTDVWSLAIIFCCMTLRRFPWKAPRETDNSYRLFVAKPDPSQETPDMRRPSEANRKSVSTLNVEDIEARRRSSGVAPDEDDDDKKDDDAKSTGGDHHRHHHHHHSSAHPDGVRTEPPSHSADDANSGNATPQSYPQSSAASQTTVIKGPWRLLRLLPRETRFIIGRMLDLSPERRATLPEILEDKWVRSAAVCRQEENGKVIRAGTHEHTLEPASGGAPKKV